MRSKIHNQELLISIVPIRQKYKKVYNISDSVHGLGRVSLCFAVRCVELEQKKRIIQMNKFEYVKGFVENNVYNQLKAYFFKFEFVYEKKNIK